MRVIIVNLLKYFVCSGGLALESSGERRIAADNANVTAHVYDLRYFEDLKNRYNVMSVPCMIINNEKVLFGKKNISQILTALLD